MISITDKQKKIIESRGFMVVEFKPEFQFVRMLGTEYRCDYTRVTIYHCRNNC